MNVIIVLNYNDFETTDTFVKNVHEYEVLNKIIIVDNCSPDGSFNQLILLQDYKVDVIQTSSNRGYSTGNNYGIKYAEEHYSPDNIIISNPDIKCSEDSIKKVINGLSDPQIGMATGVIHNFTKQGDPRIFSCFGWRLPNYWDMLSNCFLTTYKLRRCVFKNSIYFDYDALKNFDKLYVEAVPGCFFAIKDSALQDIDYLDEGPFLFHEENMLGYRLKQKQYKVVIITDAPVYHYDSVTIRKNIRKNFTRDKINLQSVEILLKKYIRANNIQWRIYSLAFWLGRWEKTVLNKIFKK